MCTVLVVCLNSLYTCQNTKKGTYKYLRFFPMFFTESYRMIDILGFWLWSLNSTNFSRSTKDSAVSFSSLFPWRSLNKNNINVIKTNNLIRKSWKEVKLIPPNRHIHDQPLSWLNIGTSMKKWRVYGTKPPTMNKWRSYGPMLPTMKKWWAMVPSLPQWTNGGVIVPNLPQWTSSEVMVPNFPQWTSGGVMYYLLKVI